MLDLVSDPEDRFSHNEVQINFVVICIGVCYRKKQPLNETGISRRMKYIQTFKKSHGKSLLSYIVPVNSIF